jgi:glycosyltransferase involved in cell wall biosynthesis
VRILIVLDNFYIPQYSGGVESCTHELALELAGRGHSVAVLCRLAMEGATGLRLRALRRFSGKPYAGDRLLGYPVYRAWDVPGALDALVSDFAPDVALIQNWSPVRVAGVLAARGIPAAVYLHNVFTELLDGDLRSLSGVRFIANSVFTAERYRQLLGIDALPLPPLFRPELYIGRRDPRNVTFVNPHPKKGSELAFAVAALCPDIPFHFVQSWTLGEDHYALINAKLKELPNLTFQKRTRNMKKVYGQAKIILAPSKCEEAWGRVASEAQFSGIPVVASNIGGLPEAVGPGGILLDPEGPAEVWADAVRRLWTDADFYREKSEAALVYSRRPEINAALQVDALLALLEAARQ